MKKKSFEKSRYIDSFHSTYLYYVYADIFEAKIQSKDLEEHFEKQFRVVVKLVDDKK